MFVTWFQSLPKAADSPDEEQDRSMKTFVWGIVLGAACSYVYVTHGAYLGATLDSLLSWRNSAQSSVAGYGGPQAKRR